MPMIRRDTTIDDAPAWIVIPQVEHARVAGRLAETLDARQFPLFAEAPLRDLLLDAVRRHDDGWAAWDPFLQLDPQTGTPRQFTEMLPGDSWPIWLHSIHGVGQTNPLGGHIVARHFAVLLGRHLAELPSDDAERIRGERFTARLDRLAAEYLVGWANESAAAAADLPDRCLAFLQAMDYLSLWLCCRERPEPLELEIDGRRVRFTADGVGRVTVSPWPFAQPTCSMAARGRAMAARRYRSNAELAAAATSPVRLDWSMSPAGGGPAREE